MATSVSRLHAQIAKLQQQADALKEAAVKRVQREIQLHGLTPDDLFGAASSVADGRKARVVKTAKAGATKAARAAKFGDSAGNTWGGMGKRPQWLKAALEAGAAIEDFLLGGASKSVTPTGTSHARRTSAAPAAATKRAAKKPAAKTSAKRKSKRTVEAAGASS
jgi:DNA-binding protein H-NS